jgi:GT2 family glycosyltransferase
LLHSGLTSYQNSHVLLVANGSPEGDSAQLATEFPEVEMLTLDRNYGFAGGCNRGMEKALADQADFIWLLNNDAIAKPESIEHSGQSSACANPEAGALGAIVLEGHSSTAEEAGLGEINFNKAKTYLRKTGLDKTNPGNSQRSQQHDTRARGLFLRLAVRF